MVERVAGQGDRGPKVRVMVQLCFLASRSLSAVSLSVRQDVGEGEGAVFTTLSFTS